MRTGVADTSLVDVEKQSDPCQLRRRQLLTVVGNGAIRVERQAVIGLGDAPGSWIDLGNGLVHPMRGDQRAELRTTPALAMCLRW
jgi:hypothetical protein